MQQELARAQRVVIVDVPLLVRTDVEVVQPRLPVLHPGVGVLEVRPAGAQRLHLGPGQRQARLVGFLDPVLVARAAVRDHRASPVGVGRALGHGAHPARTNVPSPSARRVPSGSSSDASAENTRPRSSTSRGRHDQPRADRRLAAIPHLEPGGERLLPPHVKQVGHRVVERGRDDPAVEHALVALVLRDPA